MKKPLNAAEKIREHMGCYNIMLHKPEQTPRKKKIANGELMRMARARANLTPERARVHAMYMADHPVKRPTPTAPLQYRHAA